MNWSKLMGILQKLDNMCTTGKVTIEGDRGQWYIVTMLEDDGTEFTSGMPTLKGAIESVDSAIKAYNTKINIGKLFGR